MTTTQTLAVIDINPQFGLNNSQNEGGFLLPFALGVIAGIIFAKWFL